MLITTHAIRRGALRDLAHLKSHMDGTSDKEAGVSAGYTSLTSAKGTTRYTLMILWLT